MADHIVNRYDFPTVCAGIFRLISDQTLLSKYQKHLDHKYMYYKDESEEIRAFRRVVEIIVEMVKESGIESVSINNVDSAICMKEPSMEKGQALQNFFNEWRVRPSIQEKVNDEACFESFLNYLKIVKLASVAGSFSVYYQEGKMQLASDTMRKAIEEINSITKSTNDSFNGEGLIEYLENHEKNYDHRAIMLGNDVIDEQIGGFEPQTLNLFISVTNGGKTMMAHHLVRQCIRARKKVYVACVEDRKRSFIFKVTSALTGIRTSRLKKEYRNLTPQEVELIQQAEKDMKQYLKVDFIYGNNIEQVHKAALDYDLECENRDIEKPVVNIVDYTGHIASMSAGDKGFEKMRNAYAARKDFALKYNKICFDFAQVNRDGSKRLQEDRILTQSDLAGAFDLSQVCDNIISINRNSQDITDGGCKLHIAKARDGAVGITVWVKTNFASAQYNMEELRILNAPQEVIEGYKRKQEQEQQGSLK